STCQKGRFAGRKKHMFADSPDGSVDRTFAPSGNFLGVFTGGGKCCESFSPGSPQECPGAAWKQGQDCGHGALAEASPSTLLSLGGCGSSSALRCCRRRPR